MPFGGCLLNIGLLALPDIPELLGRECKLGFLSDLMIVPELLLVGLSEPERVFSRIHSQWRASMEWAKLLIASRVEGLPC